MAARLIVTNGDGAADRMREARIAGEILPWRDILHEGPVPASLSLEELSAVRARFLAGRGWLGEDKLRSSFQARDELIRRHAAFDEVLLWFEHDLCDQLQLLQVLDFLAAEKRRTGLHLIQAGKYLGQATPRALAAHLHLMEPISDVHLALARLAWTAFRSPTPEPWASLLDLSTGILPFLRLAVLRLLDELPDRSGLSRSEWTILSLVKRGAGRPDDLYRAFTATEEAFFMGDLSFFHALDQLGGCGAPLIAGFGGLAFSPSLPESAREAYFTLELSLTHLGHSVLAGAEDALRHREVERDVGGFRLSSRAPWRWDRASRRLYPPPDRT
jgi:hypothetical protein